MMETIAVQVAKSSLTDCWLPSIRDIEILNECCCISNACFNVYEINIDVFPDFLIREVSLP